MIVDAYRPCAGVMLVNRDGLVFVGQRIDTPGGAWQMPQGGIDAGESPREAALRELWEETGIAPEHVEIIDELPKWLRYDLPEDLQGKLWGGRYVGQEQKWLLMKLIAGDDVINIATEHPEFSQWKWLAPDAVVEAIVPFKRALYRKILTGFEGALQEIATQG